MKLMKGFIILLALLFALSTATEVQAKQTSFLLNGVVINGTPDGTAPMEGQVTIQFYTENTLGNSYTTDILPDSTFVFGDLSSEIGNYFWVFTEYEGVVYYSAEAQLLESDNPEVRVTIYETTDSPENIIITNIYFLVYPGDNGYQLTEVFAIENRSQRTYTGTMIDGVLSTFSWTPPQGAQDISFMDSSTGNRYVNKGETYQDTYPIRPAPYPQEVVIAYQLPFSETVTYSNHFEYPIQQIIISGSLENIEIKGSGLKNEEVPENDAGLSTAFSAGPFDANAEITFEITSRENNLQAPVPNASGFTFNTTNFVLGISSLLVAILFSVVYFRQPSFPACPEEVKPEVRQLARLKEQFDQSEIDPKEYQTKRKQLTGAIKKKMRKDSTKTG